MESPGESRHPQERLSVGEGKQCGQDFERMGLQRGLGVGDRGSEGERSGVKIISDPVSRDGCGAGAHTSQHPQPLCSLPSPAQ